MGVKGLLGGVLLVAVGLNGQVAADEYEQGRELYRFYCSHCHNPGEGHPGTQMLASKKGVEQSVIREQQLPAEYIRTVVRRGLLEMAPFRPTEFNDAQLDELIKYLRADQP
ncbi:MAG: cytochrome c [Gammaproteobacteria bacterium]|nr:cytochrome c [Gammaproteobacteria bacterium]